MASARRDPTRRDAHRRERDCAHEACSATSTKRASDAYRHPPRSSRIRRPASSSAASARPADTLHRGACVTSPSTSATCPPGRSSSSSSDFLVAPTRDEWLDALERRFEIIPVIVQDPIWEQSFPDVSGVVVPYVEAGAEAGISLATLTRREARDLRERNERRWDVLLHGLRALDHGPVVVGLARVSARSSRRFSAGRTSDCSREDAHEERRSSHSARSSSRAAAGATIAAPRRGKAASVRGSLTPRRPPLRRAGRRADRRRRRSRPDRSRGRRREVRLQAVRRRSARRRSSARTSAGTRTCAIRRTLRCLDEKCIPSTFKYSDVPISQTPELPLFPENQQRDEKTKYEFPPTLVIAWRRVRCRRPSAASSGRRCARSPGSTGTTRASSGRASRSTRTVTPLPDDELRGYRRRSSACLLLVAASHDRRSSGAYRVRSHGRAVMPKARHEADGDVAARARACARRVGESTAFRPTSGAEALEALAYELDTADGRDGGRRVELRDGLRRHLASGGDDGARRLRAAEDHAPAT